MKLEGLQLGQGTIPTVLLHGFLGSGRNLRSLALAWSEAEPERRFWLPDLAGHGFSGALSPGARLADLAEDVLESTAALGMNAALQLVGHSMGGRVALAAQLRAPERVTCVSLLDITPGSLSQADRESGQVLRVLRAAPATAPDRRALRAALLEGGLSAGLADWLMMNVEAVEGAVRWRFDREALARLRETMVEEDLWRAVEGSGARVRCLRGGRSEYVSEDDAARMQAAGCAVETLPGVGHFIHVEAPGEVLRWLRQPFC